MGKIASKFADFVVVTDDNPRSECGQEIMSEILQGMDAGYTNFTAIQDRKSAIEYIINQCQNEDVALLAGKGHETYQVLNSGSVHFSDHEEASHIILDRLIQVSRYQRPNWPASASLSTQIYQTHALL